MKLSDICDVYSGYAFKTFNDLGHGVPVIKISNLLPDGSINLINCLFTTENIKEKYYSKKSDIYIALSGATTGKISIMDKDNTFAINQRVGIVRNRSTIPNEYLKYFLMSKSNRILEEASGCAQPNISPKQIANYDVPIYSDAVINKIVSELREIDKIKNTYQKQLELLDELVKARFMEMFGDPVLNEKSWRVIKLGELCSKICSGNTPKGGSDNYTKEGIMFFRSQNVWKNRLELDDIVYIDEATHEKMKETSLNYGDILITKTGRINTENSSLGRSALFLGKNDSANINGHVYLVRINSELVNRHFVLQILISPQYRDLIRRVCVGGIDKRQLNQNHIYDFPIIIPPLELQNQFASFVEEIDKSRLLSNHSLFLIKSITF